MTKLGDGRKRYGDVEWRRMKMTAACKEQRLVRGGATEAMIRPTFLLGVLVLLASSVVSYQFYRLSRTA